MHFEFVGEGGGGVLIFMVLANQLPPSFPCFSLPIWSPPKRGHINLDYEKVS